MKIRDVPFYVIDLETTGLEPRLDKIVECAIVKMQNGQLGEEWDSLFNPGIYIPQETTAITGITSETVKDAPLFSDRVHELLSFFGTDGVLVAHNVDFDRPFLLEALSKLNRQLPDMPYTCTLKLSRQTFADMPAYNLGELCSHFKIEIPQAHRAIHDARAAAHLLAEIFTSRNLWDQDLSEIPGIQNMKKNAEAPEGQASLF